MSRLSGGRLQRPGRHNVLGHVVVSRGHGSGVKAGIPQPPELDNLLHWYDLSDASTVWADAGTTPITDGTGIGQIDDKGTAGEAISQGTEATKPIWRESAAASGLASLEGNSGDWIGDATLASGIGTDVDWTYALVLEHIDNTVSGGPLLWDTGQKCDVFCDGTGTTDLYGAGLLADTSSIANGNTFAVIKSINSLSEDHTYGRWSYIAGESDGAIGVDVLPLDSTDFTLGARNQAGSNHFRGYIHECLIWRTVGTSALRDEFETYTTAKYGITWS